MLLLASTSDLVRVVTDTAADLDVHATWFDLNGTTVTPGRTNTPITTATTTTIVASPGASTYRTVKTIVIRCRDTVDPVRVTVTHYDGTTTVELIGVALRPGDTLTYEEHLGWVRSVAPYGTATAAHETIYTPPTAGVLYSIVLPADVANSNATANRLRDVTDLGFPVTEGHRYWFRFNLAYTAALTTTGSRWTVYGPGTVTALRYVSQYSLTTTTITINQGAAAYDIPAASNASSAATGSNRATIEGFVDAPTSDGRVFVRFASEVLSSAITLKAGSSVLWMRTT